MGPDFQVQAGMGAGLPLNQDLGGSQSNRKYYLLARQYEGPYFLQTGLGYLTTTVVPKSANGESDGEFSHREFRLSGNRICHASAKVDSFLTAHQSNWKSAQICP